MTSLKDHDWQVGLGHFPARVTVSYYLDVQMGHPAVVKVLQRFHDVSDVEGYLFFHQLIMIHKVVQEPAIIHPESREEETKEIGLYRNKEITLIQICKTFPTPCYRDQSGHTGIFYPEP